MSTPVSRVLSSAAAWLLGLCASACVTVAPSGLSAGDTANLRFTSVEVSAPAANIRWSAAEDEYLKSRNLSMTDPALARTPEARSYIEDVAAKRLKAALERKLATRTTGSRPARIVVTLKRVMVPSTTERVLIGGSPSIAADIEIVDARSGVVLTRYAGATGSAYAPGGPGAIFIEPMLIAGGLDDLYDRAANAYARQFDNWLAGS